jgi:tetratricopeptide (TPR) repeat protein
MKLTSAFTLFLAGAILVSPALAQPQGTAPRPAQAAAPRTPAERAAAAAAQRESDEILARTYMATKRYSEAITVYQKLAKANPRDPNYLNLIGIAYMKNGDLRSARTQFERCIKLEPRFADAYNNLGATWYTDKNFKRALENYQRAVALQPGVAGYHTNVGFAYFSMNRPLDAEQAFKRALLMDPNIFQQNDRQGSVLQDRSVADKGLFAFTMAKSYAEANDPLHCAAYLRRALDEGYKEMAKVYSDPAFAAVLADPDVQAVLSLIPAPTSQAAGPPAR